jgi:GntP family gluconate:H+ symporter
MMTPPEWAGDFRLRACALAAVVGLVLLVARFQVNAFVSLILASVFLGLCAGMNPAAIGGALQEGVGGVLGSVAVIIGLGTMLGRLLAESGGAISPQRRSMRWATNACTGRWPGGFPRRHPVWFTVDWSCWLRFSSASRNDDWRPLMRGESLLAGLSVAHGLVPPQDRWLRSGCSIQAVGLDDLSWSLVIRSAHGSRGRPLPQVARRRDSGRPARRGPQPTRSVERPGFFHQRLHDPVAVGLMLLATGTSLVFPETSPCGSGSFRRGIRWRCSWQ